MLRVVSLRLTDMDSIPFINYDGSGPAVHFAHANGFPPEAYRHFLRNLTSHFQVKAMLFRPLWPDADPHQIKDWRPFAEDMARFLQQQPESNWIGIGHSIGGTTTLRTALAHPDLFRAMILIDPVLFSPWTTHLWRIISRLGLAYRLHPLAMGARRRRRTFVNKQEMFRNYRQKDVFQRLSDENLQAYVEAMAVPGKHGEVHLAYPPEWEARIFVTGTLADMDIWQNLSRLSIPLLILRGAETNTFFLATAKRVAKHLPGVSIKTISETGHLLPLEKPDEVFAEIQKFVEALPDAEDQTLRN
jgi:pimeloyl-ACP methyl ester carboxylesterase